MKNHFKLLRLKAILMWKPFQAAAVNPYHYEGKILLKWALKNLKKAYQWKMKLQLSV